MPSGQRFTLKLAQAFEIKNSPAVRVGRLSSGDVTDARTLTLSSYSFGWCSVFEFSLYFQHFLKEKSVARIASKADGSSICFFKRGCTKWRKSDYRDGGRDT